MKLLVIGYCDDSVRKKRLAALALPPAWNAACAGPGNVSRPAEGDLARVTHAWQCFGMVSEMDTQNVSVSVINARTEILTLCCASLVALTVMR